MAGSRQVVCKKEHVAASHKRFIVATDEMKWTTQVHTINQDTIAGTIIDRQIL